MMRRAINTILSARHGRARPGHPRLSRVAVSKAWMPGTRPGMTSGKLERLK
jgi:hypothetical protein|uniref:Uncharacterized protein n=1 Tax=Rhodopseudomonas palustris (strain DX-1) TaxID=652103 RepID=E6VJZ9_RHOPX